MSFIKTILLELITCGLGNHLKVNLIQPIKNDFVKPKGGLWASPIKTRYGWKEWCKQENFGKLSSNFTFIFQGQILKIDSEKDLNDFLWKEKDKNIPDLFNYIPDFETMNLNGIDAIWLTEEGQWKTHLSLPKNLYGWDCECVLIMNPSGIIKETYNDKK